MYVPCNNYLKCHPLPRFTESGYLIVLQEIQRQKSLQKEQEKLEDMRVMEYLKEKEVCHLVSAMEAAGA